MDAILQNILRGLITYRVGIFALLGVGILVYLRKLIISLREWQSSVFGLERSIAQRKLISASTGLMLLLFLFVGEFLLVTVIEPQMPIDVSTSQPAVDSPVEGLEIPQSAQVDSEGTPVDNAVINALSGVDGITGQGELVFECIDNILEITSPADGDSISGTVEIIGSVNVDNFGSYKYEYSPMGNINWVTIAAGNQLKLDENIGFWFTSALPPGIYLLRLVPLDNAGQEMTPCIITVDVQQAQED